MTRVLSFRVQQILSLRAQRGNLFSLQIKDRIMYKQGYVYILTNNRKTVLLQE